jgi:myo-inositol-1(or 4)-monophosphatase
MILYSVRALGSAALNMCFVAAGRADAYYEFGVHCWDVAAGIVILKEAGGISLGAAGQFSNVSVLVM